MPSGWKPVGCKLIFKTKHGSEWKVERYKSRHVVKGYTQNQVTIAIARNLISHARTKHIDIKFRSVHEALHDRIIEYCPTDQMTANILTKPLSCNRFEILLLEMGLKNLPSIMSI